MKRGFYTDVIGVTINLSWGDIGQKSIYSATLWVIPVYKTHDFFIGDNRVQMSYVLGNAEKYVSNFKSLMLTTNRNEFFL